MIPCSDDQERTLGSGQSLMDGIFPPDGSLSRNIDHMITWNVADYSTDHVNANENICPLMGYIGNLSNNSPEFLKYISGPAQLKIEKDFKHVVGNFSWGTVLECLSTARCNDLDLPDGVDEEQFTKVFSEVEAREALYLTYNNSWFSKTAMQPLVHEIITRLDAVVKGAPTAPKFAITLGEAPIICAHVSAKQEC